MDISKLTISDNFDVEITMPNGAETDLIITVAGQDSDVYKKHAMSTRNKRIKDMQRGKKNNTTAEQLEESGVDLLVACSVGWRGFELNGEQIVFSADAVRDIYEQHAWIRDQVDVAIVDRSNFM